MQSKESRFRLRIFFSKLGGCVDAKVFTRNRVGLELCVKKKSSIHQFIAPARKVKRKKNFAVTTPVSQKTQNVFVS